MHAQQAAAAVVASIVDDILVMSEAGAEKVATERIVAEKPMQPAEPNVPPATRKSVLSEVRDKRKGKGEREIPRTGGRRQQGGQCAGGTGGHRQKEKYKPGGTSCSGGRYKICMRRTTHTPPQRARRQ